MSSLSASDAAIGPDELGEGAEPVFDPIPTAAEPVVGVGGLTVFYGTFTAVKGISFNIPKGEVFGFIGPNGAGKSSTIRVLATLQRDFWGTATVCGYDVRRHPTKVREKIGFVPDFFGVYDDLNTREYLQFFAAAYGLPTARRKAVIDDVLELTDLTRKIDAPVDSLSRGMKQRLSLARVLLHDPELLLLDEPASGLDPRARIEMRELLLALKEMGKTILISSHILHELSSLCTRIGIIEAGKLVAAGSLDEIYRRLELQRVVNIQLAGDVEPIAAALGEIEGVESLELEPERLTVRLREDLLPIEELHAELVKAGARVRLFQPQAMDMETAFMRLTEGVTS